MKQGLRVFQNQGEIPKPMVLALHYGYKQGSTDCYSFSKTRLKIIMAPSDSISF